MIEDDSLIELFLLEVQNYTQVLTEELFSKSKPEIDVVIRAFHSIRGAGRIIQLEEIARLAGALEDYFASVKDEELPLDTIGLSVNFLCGLGYQTLSEFKTLVPKLAPIVASHLEIIERLPEDHPPKVEAFVQPEIDTSLPDLSDFSMLELFKLEVETQVSILNQGILSLENDIKNKDQIDTLMRAAHSIKGAARIVQIEPVVQLSHIMEDCFIAAKEGKLTLENHHLDSLFESIDLIAEIGKRLTPDDSQALNTLKPKIEQTVASLLQISQSNLPQKFPELYPQTTVATSDIAVISFDSKPQEVTIPDR